MDLFSFQVVTEKHGRLWDVQLQWKSIGKTLLVLHPIAKSQGWGSWPRFTQSCRSRERKNGILELGLQGISCCPRWPDPHSWAIIYFIFADKLPERVISDVNMEIDTTSNGPPLSFPVPSPHGEQTWACKIHQSSTAAPTKCYESRIVMHKCLPRVAPFNSETKPCEWTKLGGWHQNII